MSTARRHRAHRGRAALEAVASPARQELLLALGEGEASVRELAVRLGRSRSALHYHAGVLERAGMIKSVEVRGTGRERETVYAHATDKVAVNARNRPAELEVAKRAGLALLRLTGRELVRALDDAGATVPRALYGARGKARLTPAKLARVNALIEELLGVFADAPPERGPTPQLYALTVVLTPSRDASAPKRRRRRRLR
ncbi:MAG TPA: winged helix-turn-helix domain-containing protein [Kofleriaceae bacterium]